MQWGFSHEGATGNNAGQLFMHMITISVIPNFLHATCTNFTEVVAG